MIPDRFIPDYDFFSINKAGAIFNWFCWINYNEISKEQNADWVEKSNMEIDLLFH